METFFSQQFCDRCGSPLSGGRTMSMFNEDCICMACAKTERANPNYSIAVESDHKAIKSGNYNFKGIGLSATHP